MESSGWVFEWNGKTVFGYQPTTYCQKVPSTSYCGFRYPGDGVVSYTFTTSGIGTLSYGQSWHRGSVHVSLNNQDLGSRSNRGNSVLKFQFSTGDILRIKETDSVMNINSLCTASAGSYLECYCVILFYYIQDD